MPEPRPWFPFYGKDWTASTRNLSPEAKGCYIDLLAYAWDNHGIPLDDEERRLVTGADRAQWRRVWAKLEPRFDITEAGRMVNPRQERIRAEVTAFQAAGRASAEARRRRHGTAQPPNVAPNDRPNDSPNVAPNERPASPELSQSQSQPQKKHPPTPKGAYTPDFERFWAAYPNGTDPDNPRRGGKAAAFKAWQKIAPDEDFLGRMLSTVAWQQRTRDWTKDGGAYIPNVSTWLNNRRWEDEPPAAQKPLPPVDWQ